LARLVAARRDDDEAELLHETSRRQLASEFFRRKAVWANALGVTERWPFWNGQGGIELPIAGVAYLSLADRLAQAPIAIDAATLAEMDEKDRIELEEARAVGGLARPAGR
jgi:hypothetical protein